MQIRPTPHRFIGIVQRRSRPPAVTLNAHIDLSTRESTKRTVFEVFQQLEPLMTYTNRGGAVFVEIVDVGSAIAADLEAEGEPPLHKGDVVAVGSFAGEVIYDEDGTEYVLLSRHDIAGRITLEDAPVLQ